jgi:hypothetical protein
VAAWAVAGGGGAPSTRASGFRQSGIVGGGFVNVIAVDPSGSGLVIAGGDVSGLHRSVDFGQHWTQANTGVTAIAQLKVASIAFSPSTPGEVYAAVGDEGSGGGVLVSTDTGLTWELRSATPQFSGGNNDAIPTLPPTHPRSTGSLFAFDPGRDLVYAASFEGGVMRSADHGRSWTALGPSGRYLRGIAIDPAHPNTLYVAAYGAGVYETTDASEAGTFTRLPSAPATPEEVAMIGSDLYVAAGSAGIYRSADGGIRWSLIGGTGRSGSVWISLAGYRACGRIVVYAGADEGGAGGVVRSMDGGDTWTSLVTDPARMHDEIGGPGGEPWWLYTPSVLPGGSTYTASAIAVGRVGSPHGGCLPREVFLAGRSGVWRSTDGGTQWYPAMGGLGVTIVRGVALDSTRPGHVYTATADWVQVASTDDGDHVVQQRPPGGATGFDVEVDAGAEPPRVFVATGSPTENSDGEVYSIATTMAGGWTDEGLSEVAHGSTPLGIAVGQVGTTPVLLVATEGQGVWRKSGSSWTQVSTSVMQGSEPSHAASMVWPPGPFVYLFDHSTGIWRSSDSGVTWTRIWAQVSESPLTGFLAADPSAPGRLYVSVGGRGVFRIDDARSGRAFTGEVVPVEVGAFTRPGAIAVDRTGVLYVATVAEGGGAELYRSTEQGASFTLVSGPVWSATAGYVNDLEVSPDGELFAALNGDGLLHGRPGP